MSDFTTDVAALSQARHTCKAYDKTKRIDEQTLQQILEALRFAPSSINIQPWRFLVADNDTAKARIAKSMTDGDTHNVSKVMNASHTLILCTHTTLDDAHLQKILNAEEQAGRFTTPQSKAARLALCQNYLHQYAQDPAKLSNWAEQQTFIALGHLLMVAKLAGVDATAIGGFNADVINEEFDLTAQQLTATVIVSLGYGSDDDFNKTLPKARLDFHEVIQFI